MEETGNRTSLWARGNLFPEDAVLPGNLEREIRLNRVEKQGQMEWMDEARREDVTGVLPLPRQGEVTLGAWQE